MRPSRVAALILATFSICVSHAQTLTVLAAASLKESFVALAQNFEAAHAGWKVEISFAGSQQLASQLALGAPADVFASADEAQMTNAVRARRAASPIVFAYNKLMLVVSKTASSRLTSIKNLGDPSLRLLIGVPQVPVGHYGLQFLDLAAQDQGADWLKRVKANIVSQELDVRAILAKVELGEADAGIVYATDARSAGAKVVSIPIPDAFNVKALYLIAAIDKSVMGQAFESLVLGGAGRAALAARGFSLPEKPHP